MTPRQEKLSYTDDAVNRNDPAHVLHAPSLQHASKDVATIPLKVDCLEIDVPE